MARVAQPVSSRRLAADDDEARLAHAAADGDRHAFAALYERYGQRAFALAYRISGSRDGAARATRNAFVDAIGEVPQLTDRGFGPHLLAAACASGHEAIGELGDGEPLEAAHEPAAPGDTGPTGGRGGLEPDEDSALQALAEAEQDEIQEANFRLPPRQREVLALGELDGISHGGIADIMGVSHDSVTRLISNARISLHRELHGTAAASIEAVSGECERAVPLIAMRDDAQLDDDEDAGWLLGHLAHCARCRLRLDAMQEALASYRRWAPVAAPPMLLEETLAVAAELTGTERTEVIEKHPVGQPADDVVPGLGGIAVGDRGAAADAGSTAGDQPGDAEAARGRADRAEAAPRHLQRRSPLLTAGLALLALLGVAGIVAGGTIIVGAGGDSPAPVNPVVAQGGAGDRARPPAPEAVRRRREATPAPEVGRASSVQQRFVAPVPPTGRARLEPTPRRPARRPSRRRPARQRGPAATVPAPQSTPRQAPPVSQPAPTVPPAIPPSPSPVPPQPAICTDGTGRPIPCSPRAGAQ